MTISDNLAQKNANSFECLTCDFLCFKKSEWKRHISTTKHKNNVKNNDKKYEENEKKKYTCENCNKIYSFRQGLSFHKKSCFTKNKSSNEELIINSETQMN